VDRCGQNLSERLRDRLPEQTAWFEVERRTVRIEQLEEQIRQDLRKNR
jgi:hypothetical protein